jgi:hypothetical protein
LKTPPSNPEFARFAEFTRRLVSVPHSEIREKLEAEKAAKNAAKSSSHVSAAQTKRP